MSDDINDVPIEPVAWTNEYQFSYLKHYAETPMAMWGKPNGAADIPLYRAPPHRLSLRR